MGLGCNLGSWVGWNSRPKLGEISRYIATKLMTGVRVQLQPTAFNIWKT